MNLDGIPDPVLRDMEATLKGDAPILIGCWVMPATSPDNPFKVDCGCLMADGHVQEILAENGAGAGANYWARNYYLGVLKRSKLWRRCNLQVDDVDRWARRFDAWSTGHELRWEQHEVAYGSVQRALSTVGRAQLLVLVRERLRYNLAQRRG